MIEITEDDKEVMDILNIRPLISDNTIIFNYKDKEAYVPLDYIKTIMERGDYSLGEALMALSSVGIPNEYVDEFLSDDDEVEGGNRFARLTQAQRIERAETILGGIIQRLNSLRFDYNNGVINQDKYLKKIQDLTNYSKEYEPRPFERYFTNQEKQAIKNELQNIKQRYTTEFYEIKNDPRRQKIDKKEQKKFLKEQSKSRKTSEEDEKESIREATNQPQEIADIINRYTRNINQDDLINEYDEDRIRHRARVSDLMTFTDETGQQRQRLPYELASIVSDFIYDNNEHKEEEDDMDGSGKPNYALHAVIVKKPVKLERAQEIAHNFIDKSKKYYRETKSSYRFRNIPKQLFIPKSYRTKKVNKQISLIYGELKDSRIQGGSLKDLWNSVKDKVRQFKQNPMGAVLNAEYCAPFTDLSTDRKPTSATDAVCKEHDYAYQEVGKAKERGVPREERIRMTRRADDAMINQLENFKEKGLQKKALHFFSKNGIKLKRYLEDKGIIDPLKFSGGLYYEE
jgi:hypothetical protein